MLKHILIFTLLCLSAAAVAADSHISRFPVTVSTGYTLDAGEHYLAPGIQAAWRPGLAGIGIGLDAYLGLRSRSIFTAAYARGNIGLLYTELGALFELQGPIEREGFIGVSAADSDTGYSPYLGFGLRPRLRELAGGHLVLDAGLKAFIGAIYIEEQDDFESALGTALASPFILVFHIPKLHIGIGWQLP